jgi:hypothetical protein
MVPEDDDGGEGLCPSQTWFMGYMKFCCAHIKHTNKHRPYHLFLLSSGVHTSVFLSILQDITELILFYFIMNQEDER